MVVLQLHPERWSAGSPDDDLLVCECGSGWFELCTVDADGTKVHGVVALDAKGSVTAYSGTPHCCECGRERLP
jgi:hypothetical protein